MMTNNNLVKPVCTISIQLSVQQAQHRELARLVRQPCSILKQNKNPLPVKTPEHSLSNEMRTWTHMKGGKVNGGM